MRLLLAALGVLAMANWTASYAEGVMPDEMATARQWVAARFEGVETTPDPGLEVIANYDSVQKNARFGKPLNLGGKRTTRGLFCHAPSKIRVRLPGPGAGFTAAAGVDSNEQTAGGQGSVVFSVQVAGKETFRSGVLRESSPAVPVRVDLAGAREFLLEVGDSGDGISCDQADWADAQVTLADGRTLWLADLPLADGPAAVGTEPPFSFLYDGKPSADLLKTWRCSRASRELDRHRREHVLAYTEPGTGLVVRCVAVEYLDFPTVEWTLHLKNTGAADTPILQDIQVLDIGLSRGHYGEFLLHHAVGSPCTNYDYRPLQTRLEPNTVKRIGAAGGRPTNSDLSYFSIASPVREGLIAVVGWPGQWAAQLTRDGELGLRVRAGQELTHFRLRPGEEVRTPLLVLQFWNGEPVHAQNVWRRWMLAHNVPRPGGKPLEPAMFGCSSHQFGEMVNADEASQKLFIDRYLEERLKIDYWWMDAGWYVNETGWPNTGTWEVDTKRFPKGLRAITDHAHAKGMKSILWFEPERVTPGTWLYQKHPEWLLGRDGDQKLLDLGNPEARGWLTDHVDHLLTEQGIDLYRQDHNFDPLVYWRANDADDRQGITEIRHVEGYLAFWDELRRHHPDLLIDSCASGGRRNDLETMRRSVPLWRSDYILEPIGTQCHTYGISSWIPLHGTGTKQVDAYDFRSNMVPYLNCLWDVRAKSLDYALLRRLTEEWRSVSRCFLGDYYPLTAYSLEDDAWMAWQYDRPDLGDGVVQAFRRAGSPVAAIGFQLKGLDPDATYAVRNLDDPRSTKKTGRDLMERYLLVEITDRPGAALITYRKAR